MAHSQRLPLTSSLVAHALGTPPVRCPDHPASDEAFAGVATDSRKVPPGSLFVAIAGETFDGNDYVEAALARGARGAICRTGVVRKFALSQKYPNALIYEVPDSLEGFRKLAHAWRRSFTLPLAMVAGSAGKTTTKELLASLLSGEFAKVLKTQGSNNGFVGIPLTLTELSAEHQAAVIEVGIDEPGAMLQHVELVSPDVAVLTSVGAEHLEKLIDVETVAREEGIAFEYAIRENRKVAVNLDDPHIESWFLRAPARLRLGFSLARPATGDTLHGALSNDHSRLRVEGAGLSAEFPLPLPGRHNATNLLAAIATARLMGLEAPGMLKGLQSFVGAEGRSQVRTLSKDLYVLCDYYNAQPPSLSAAIELLAELSNRLAPGAPRWACLADMLELGPEELRFHREMAPKIIALGLEHVLLLGERMKALADELSMRGFRGDLRHFPNREELGDALAHEAHGPCVILIKGSHSMRMEDVWKRLEAARQ